MRQPIRQEAQPRLGAPSRRPPRELDRASSRRDIAVRGRAALLAVALAALGTACISPEESALGAAPSAVTTPPTVLASNAIGQVRAAVAGSTCLVVWQTASGIEAARVDATGTMVGGVSSLGSGTDSLTVGGGNGVFTVVVGSGSWAWGVPMKARRLAEDGTLIDASWVPLTASGAYQYATPGVTAFNGSEIVLDYTMTVMFVSPYDSVRTLTIPTAGPMPVDDAVVAGGDKEEDVWPWAAGCVGATCAHLVGGDCGIAGCTPDGTRLVVGAMNVQIDPSPYHPASMAADAAGFLASRQSPAGIEAQRFDLAGSPVGGAIAVADEPGAKWLTSTFDGSDFAVVWATSPSGDVLANWVSPAGTVAFATPEQVVTAAGQNIPVASLASFGSGSALLATRQGSDVVVRVLAKGCGMCDDGESCTADSCDLATVSCVHSPLADGTSCPSGTCQSGFCAPPGSSGSGAGGGGGGASSGGGGASSGGGGGGGSGASSSSGGGGADTTTGAGGNDTGSSTGSGGVGGSDTGSSSTTDSSSGTIAGSGGGDGEGGRAGGGTGGPPSYTVVGCACRAAVVERPGAGAVMFFVLGLALAARRRRPRHSHVGPRASQLSDQGSCCSYQR